jgi:hypothetical protein
MAQFVGVPNIINRFLGLCDQDDQTNLPIGLAWVCRNMQFSLTSAKTRDGINKAIQGINKSPITGLLGLVYQPESDTEAIFQRPLLFDMMGALQAEYEVGTGVAKQITSTLFSPPQVAHMIAVQAYNKAWMAFSDLITPKSRMAVYKMKTDTLDPFGMKPYGWNWAANTPCIAGEVATPSVDGGNGHTYLCTQAGTTGAVEPVWPTTEGATVNDGTVVWKEQTAVMANRLPSPPSPTLVLTAGGTVPIGDVWVVLTYSNQQGETTASTPVKITTTAGNQSFNVVTPGLTAFSQWIQTLAPEYVPTKLSIYLAVVAAGAAQPPGTAYYKSQDFNLTAQAQYTIPVTGPATGSQLGYAAGVIAGTEVNQSNNALVPDDNSYNAAQWEVASASPHQLRTTGAATSAPGLLDYVYAKNLGFNIPSGVTILGISIDVGFVAQSATSATIQNVSLCYSGANLGTAKTPNKGFTTVNQDLVLGSNSDLWGAALTPAIVNDPSFGFGVQVNVQTVRCFLNSFSVTVYYAEQANSQAVNAARITPGQLPTPTAGPNLQKLASQGSFPIHRDVYVCITYTNAAGETLPGPPSAVYDTATNDAVQATLKSPGNFQYSGINVYECDVPTGAPQPPFSQFALVGSYSATQSVLISQSASGSPPPTANTTGPGGQIAADTPTGGVNSTQGYRYAAIMFINRNDTMSGFTKNSVIKYAVDQDGWQLGLFNVPAGPSNVAARAVGFTVADGTPSGDFFVIGGWASNTTDNLVYPKTVTVDGIPQTATVLGDNVSTSGTFNFTDSFLIANIGTNVTDRLRVIWPYEGVDVYYSESTDRLFVTGAPGFNGHWVSLKGDPESFYGDTCFIATNNSDGERAICVREYRGSLYSFRERSAYVITPGDGDPATWSIPVRRWSKVGPCGPRAVDVDDDFIIFAHRSGVYRYTETNPDLMTKEVPKLWNSINWSAGQTICVKIDRETHTVRILVPVGNSTIPNQEIVLSYIEGWQNPIHFSPYAQREVSMDAARRWSINDVAAYVCGRVERLIPNAPPFLDGVDGVDDMGSSWYISQFLYGSSAPDGTVQAITPGIYQDNGTGIRSEYETVCPQNGMALSKLEGFTLNAKGNGTLLVSALSGRDMTSDWAPEGSAKKSRELHARPVDLSPDQPIGISRMYPSRISERWRLRFRTDWQPGSWMELKWASIYTIPVASARTEGEG